MTTVFDRAAATAAPSTSPRPPFEALAGSERRPDGTVTAPCPACLAGASGGHLDRLGAGSPGLASMLPNDITECDRGCEHWQITTALFNGSAPAAGKEAAGLRIVRASDVEIEQVQFLIPDRVPLGAVTLAVGDPGLGKSTLTMAWAAGTTTGRYGKPAAVLIANAEDSAAHVTVPRLAAASAKLDMVEFFSVAEGDGERTFTIPDDVPRLEAHAAKVGARLVVVDPLNAHLADGTNAHRDHSIRRALAPLSAMAQRLGVAVVVVAHLDKAQGSDALYPRRGAASASSAALARSCCSPATPTRSRATDNASRLLTVKAA